MSDNDNSDLNQLYPGTVPPVPGPTSNPDEAQPEISAPINAPSPAGPPPPPASPPPPPPPATDNSPGTDAAAAGSTVGYVPLTASANTAAQQASNAANPTMPGGAAYTPTAQTAGADELLNNGWNAEAYKQQNPDVAKAWEDNPDIRQQFGGVEADFLKWHYDTYGAGEGRGNGSVLGQVHDTAAQGETATAADPTKTDAHTYDATTIDPNAAQATAQQGEVGQQDQVQAQIGALSPAIANMLAQYTNMDTTMDPRSLVQTQYAALTDFSNGIPAWARGAYTQAMSDMAARGLGASSMAAGASTAAILQAAMPIAQQDAQVFANLDLKKLDQKQQAVFLQAGYLAQMDMKNLDNRQQAAVVNAQNFMQMDLANLNNRQQAEVINTQARAQAMLSNQAAENAAKQYNASSQQQNDQFFANLSSQIDQFNTTQTNSMTQFNVGQANAMTTFDAQMNNQRDMFNTQNAMVIQQSNVNYLRQINTQNTAQINQANYVNSQNLLGISNTAMANSIQLARDNESYNFQASMNADNRAANRMLLVLSQAFSQSIFDQQSDAALGGAVGSALFKALPGLLTSLSGGKSTGTTGTTADDGQGSTVKLADTGDMSQVG